MQYVWQHRLWTPADMTTVDGLRVTVVDPGLLNTGSGPDFFNAKIEIGGKMWAGNVEIHVRASDWHRHGHDGDHAYDSVILHVVDRDDARIMRPGGGGEIPQLVMPCSPDFSRRYSEMVDRPLSELACAGELPSLPGVHLTAWLDSLAIERLSRKAERILELVRHFEGHWDSAVYVVLARALGFGLNSDAFERLALSVPLRTLLKHRDSPVALEGILFGQAGFLDSPEADPGDHYVARMKEEYRFMANKFGLTPPHSLGWRMARMRPQNFPHRRIATLAAMIADGFRIGYGITEVSTEQEARRLFAINLTGYWSRRYNFGPPSARSVRALSDSSISILIINVVAPVLYAHSIMSGSDEARERAIGLLQSLKPESNHITTLFAGAGVDCRNAFDSQALIELRNNYCNARKCLYCRIGHRFLAAKARRIPD